MVAGLSSYVADTMGPHFVEPQPFDLAPCYADSSPSSPLVFLLSPGADPMVELLRFAEERGARVEAVSLGQGQGPVAQKWIEEGAAQGFWVVLQVLRKGRLGQAFGLMICLAALALRKQHARQGTLDVQCRRSVAALSPPLDLNPLLIARTTPSAPRTATWRAASCPPSSPSWRPSWPRRGAPTPTSGGDPLV